MIARYANKLLFKNELISAGKFRFGWNHNGGGRMESVELNGIAKQVRKPLSIDKFSQSNNSLKVYPNPVRAGKFLSIENNENADEYTLSDLSGKEISRGKIKNNSLVVPDVAAGNYLLTTFENNTNCGSTTIIIR